MSNKTQLQTNNATLDTLIARVNSAKNTASSLPEAGGGGSSSGETIETCTGTVILKRPPFSDGVINYVDQNMNLTNSSLDDNHLSFSCMKNSIIHTNDWSAHSITSGDIELIDCAIGQAVFFVSGDFVLTFD